MDSFIIAVVLYVIVFTIIIIMGKGQAPKTHPTIVIEEEPEPEPVIVIEEEPEPEPEPEPVLKQPVNAPIPPKSIGPSNDKFFMDIFGDSQLEYTPIDEEFRIYKPLLQQDRCGDINQ